MPKRPVAFEIDQEIQRKLATDLFNFTWTLLKKLDRTEREKEDRDLVLRT